LTPLSNEQRVEITNYLNQEEDELVEVIPLPQTPVLIQQDTIPPPLPEMPLPQQNDGLICRICHSDIELPAEIDEVISPCRCTGSQALVHVECFNEWGRERCEICHFRFYAGEEPPEPRMDNQNAFFMAPLNLPEDPAQRLMMINALIDQMAQTVPEDFLNGYRIRVFYIMVMKTCVDIMIEKHSRLRLMYKLSQLWLWHLNEVFRIADMRLATLCSALICLIFSISAFIFSPFLYFYHEVRTRPGVIFNYLKVTWTILMIQDLLLDLANHMRQDMYYQTVTQTLKSFVYQDNMCYNYEMSSPAFVTHHIPYLTMNSMIDWMQHKINEWIL
jgi:hypothetical protein